MNRLLSLVILALFSLFTQAQEHLRLATTTSTQDSGLLEALHPPLEAALQAKIYVIAVGSGKALKLGENGDVDVLLVHDPAAEEQFVAAGFGVERQPVMHNDFVLLGPSTDPAGVRQSHNLSDALKKIAATSSAFVSRGDESGTHQKELQLWRAAGVDPTGNWYMAVGQGMGAVLKIAHDKLAYTLSDRGTYLAFKNKIDLVVVYQGTPELFNPYHVILANPQKHPHVKYDLARRYAEFIRGKEGQRIIREFKIGGEPLFHPDVLTR